MQKLLRILLAGVWALAVAWGLTLSFKALRAEPDQRVTQKTSSARGSTEAL